eukprot:COSAG02_NODE_2456_length_8812_cov_2.849535_6_plen_159_part_00
MDCHCQLPLSHNLVQRIVAGASLGAACGDLVSASESDSHSRCVFSCCVSIYVYSVARAYIHVRAATEYMYAPRARAARRDAARTSRRGGAATALLAGRDVFRVDTKNSLSMVPLRLTVVSAWVMGCYAANPECRLAAATLPRFKYESFSLIMQLFLQD